MNIGLPATACNAVSVELNKLLANEYALYTKTLKFHWNVRGKHFGPLHALFQKHYEQLLDMADRVAERVRALDLYAYGTLKEFATHMTISEHPGVNPADLEMIKILVGDHETVIQQLRPMIKLAVSVQDEGTNNMLADLIEEHEKMAWMLRAHLE
jgi:starvation-inducible DNA-binding protein